MKRGMTFSQRDVLLIPVPFSDLSSSKRRPVVVLSGDTHNAQSPDLVVAAITSNLGASIYGVIISATDTEGGVLPRTSLVRPDKIYTLSKTIVVRKFDRLTADAFERVLTNLDLVIPPVRAKYFNPALKKSFYTVPKNFEPVSR